VAHLDNPGGAPYALMVFAGMLPWQFFSNALSEAGNSLINNSNLITKVYFPRLIIPVSSVFTGLVDFFISFCILLLMFLWYGYGPDWKIVFLPFLIMLSFLCALGFGLFLAALNVRYRDFRYVIPFLIQIGLYISPVGFSSSVIDPSYRWAYSLNPMTGIIDGFRWCLLGDPLHIDSFLISLIPVLIVALLGVKYFRRVERSFADTI
jgi:lipopolysaccharide transport system permease protein